MIKKNNKISNRLNEYFATSSNTIIQLSEHWDSINRMAKGIANLKTKRGKLIIAGNGGSSADADHFAGEMTCTYKNKKRKGFSALSLTSNSAAMSAWANDFGYDTFFSRQVSSLGNKQDILFLISTGGGDKKNGFSMNLVNGAIQAKKMGIKVYSLIGKSGGELLRISDTFIKVKSNVTSHIQEAHIAIIHAICELLDE